MKSLPHTLTSSALVLAATHAVFAAKPANKPPASPSPGLLNAALRESSDTSHSFYNIGGVSRGGTAATPGTGYGVNPGHSNFAGAELDLVANYTVMQWAQIEAGYGHFFHGEYLAQSLSAPPPSTEMQADMDILTEALGLMPSLPNHRMRWYTPGL